jgi:sorbitol-specific phosphotransferase system component IIC
MDFLLGGVTGIINGMSKLLNGFSFTHSLGADIALIMPYINKGNALVPVDTALTILSIWISINLLLMAYYWITRVINLLRGAG